MTRETQRQLTRQRVVRHAMRVCALHGFDRARTADIAKAVGISHGAIFVHFPTRDQLMIEVAAQLGSKITDRLHALAQAGASLEEALAAHLNALQDHEALYRSFLLARPSEVPGFRTAWTGIQSAVSSYLEQSFRAELDAKRVRKFTWHLLFNTWLGLVHHYLIHGELFAPRRSVLAEYGPRLAEHFLNLISERTAV